jgi:hypothetical protein
LVISTTDKHLLIADMAIPSQSEISSLYYKKLISQTSNCVVLYITANIIKISKSG